MLSGQHAGMAYLLRGITLNLLNTTALFVFWTSSMMRQLIVFT